MPSSSDVEFLKEAVEVLHGCHASYVTTVVVQEMFEGQIAWAGSVSVFAIDRPDVDTCYAWLSPVEGSDGKKVYTVLKKPPVDSPGAAVRASIAADHKKSL